MQIRQPLLWLGVTAAIGFAIFLRNGEDEPAQQAASPDLFSFVRALPADAGNQPARESSPPVVTVELPQPEPAAVQAGNAFQTEAAVRRMRAQGASEDEVYRARAAAMGAESAATLARLDQEEALWQQRVATYLAQRQASAADPATLQALRDRLFTAEEQGRLAAYEPAPAPLTGMPQ
ncbi:lipase secretion chaperone [Noviherbaspirillum sp. ST9]|uniref:lipase secretion chaperone n=1 Tax=Noviherbaspirillum sp. ST9 TaxID=3401606 RepID=UPI003B58B3D6